MGSAQTEFSQVRKRYTNFYASYISQFHKKNGAVYISLTGLVLD